MWAVETKTEDIVAGILSDPQPIVPAPITHIGACEVKWWEGKPKEAVVMATGGSAEDRYLAEQIVTAQLVGIGYKRAQFTFDADHKTAGWPDIMAKATRLVQSNAVTVLRNGYNTIVGHVIGDHGEYNTEIGREDPSSRKITTWQCECPWDQYAWQRTRKWKKYEGRPCAHVMALYWKALATPLDDYDPEEHGPMGTGQKQGPPVPPPAPGGEGAPPGGPSPVETPPAVPDTLPRSFSPEDAEGFSPPASPGVLPTPPMDQLAEQMPPVPGQTPGGMPANPSIVSVPGAKMPTPFNPIQFPGGTYSRVAPEPPNYRAGRFGERCGNCKMNDDGKCWGYGNKKIELWKVCDSWTEDRKNSKTAAAEEFVAPEIVQLKEDCYGMAEGKSDAHGNGQYQNVAAGARGEVLGQDPTTGWVEIIVPLSESSYLEPYHVKLYVEPNQIQHTTQAPPGPFIKRR